MIGESGLGRGENPFSRGSKSATKFVESVSTTGSYLRDQVGYHVITFTLFDFQALHTPDLRDLDSSARPPAPRVSIRRAWKINIILAGRRDTPAGREKEWMCEARREVCEE